jgi:hypothetical protein
MMLRDLGDMNPREGTGRTSSKNRFEWTAFFNGPHGYSISYPCEILVRKLNASRY